MGLPRLRGLLWGVSTDIGIGSTNQTSSLSEVQIVPSTVRKVDSDFNAARKLTATLTAKPMD
jgi:hypothetical protein